MSLSYSPAPPAPPTHDGGGDEGHPCPWWPRHLPIVTYSRRWRDRFRKRFWVRCWTCDLCEGPFEIDAMASFTREVIER